MDKLLTVKVSNRLYEKLRECAFVRRQSIGSIVRAALADKIETKNIQKPKNEELTRSMNDERSITRGTEI